MKRIISFLLVFVMLVLTLSSCEFVENGIEKIEQKIHNYNEVVASSENFEITYSMMEYFANAYYSNWYSQNFYYIMQGQVKFDPSKPLNEQYVDDTNKQTYFDFFVEKTKETVSTYLKYCEAAFNDPDVNYTEIKADAEKYAQEAIVSIEETAKTYDVSFKSYIRQYFGESATKDSLIASLIIEKIAVTYYDIAFDRVSDGITKDLENEYFANNLSSFVKAECLIVTLPIAEEEKIQKLANAENIDEFNALINELNCRNVNRKEFSYDISSELGKFLFGGVKEQYGIGKDENGAKNAQLYDSYIDNSREGYLTLYFVTKAAYRDETPLRNFGHILFKVDINGGNDTTVSYRIREEAKNAAKALLAKIELECVDGVISKEKFAEFAKNTHDSNIFYEDVRVGDLVKDFENWLFNATLEGSVDLIETEYGYHIVYYGGESELTEWRYEAREGATVKAFDEWFNSLETKVSINDFIFEDFFK